VCRLASNTASCAAPGALGLVHGGVGIAQHVLGPAVAEGAEGDADAGGTGDFVVAHHEGLAQRGHQPLGQHHGVVLVHDVVGQDRELVAAQPRQHVARAQLLLHAPRHLLQQLVAGGVAQAVVDELEAVEVQEHHGKAVALVGVAARHRAGQAFQEAAPVGQPVSASWKAMCCSPASARLRALTSWACRMRQGASASGSVKKLQCSDSHTVLPSAWRQRSSCAKPWNSRLSARPSCSCSAARSSSSTWRWKGCCSSASTPLAQHRRQRRVGLQDAAVEVQQRHADGGVREGAVEAPLAGAQFAQVAFGGLGLACGQAGLARGHLGAGVAQRLGGFLLAEVEVQRHQQHHQQRHHHHQHAGALFAQVTNSSVATLALPA
jgi:hypothetical protein